MKGLPSGFSIRLAFHYNQLTEELLLYIGLTEKLLNFIYGQTYVLNVGNTPIITQLYPKNHHYYL